LKIQPREPMISVVTLDAPPPSVGKRMKLRYAGTCRDCSTALPAGETAIYHRDAKQVQCLSCISSVPAAPAAPAAPAPIVPPAPDEPTQGAAPAEAPIVTVDEQLEAGTAGASARREHERRVAKREERIRAKHPKIGGFILAMTDEPQSTRAWEVGARGEELLAKRLDGLSEQGVLVLHDRRIPGTRANIDHVVVAPAGVFVIDAKRYKGRPHLKVEGGFMRPRVEKLIVGSRDCTKLVAGVTKQVDLVRAALSRESRFEPVPLRGMLCFVEADWPLFGGSFVTVGVDVLWPKKAVERIVAECESQIGDVQGVYRHLASAFPMA
jgi:hypothetical protein